MIYLFHLSNIQSIRFGLELWLCELWKLYLNRSIHVLFSWRCFLYCRILYNVTSYKDNEHNDILHLLCPPSDSAAPVELKWVWCSEVLKAKCIHLNVNLIFNLFFWKISFTTALFFWFFLGINFQFSWSYVLWKEMSKYLYVQRSFCYSLLFHIIS